MSDHKTKQNANLNDTVDLFRIKYNRTAEAVGSLNDLANVGNNDSDLVQAINSLGDNFKTSKIEIYDNLTDAIPDVELDTTSGGDFFISVNKGNMLLKDSADVTKFGFNFANGSLQLDKLLVASGTDNPASNGIQFGDTLGTGRATFSHTGLQTLILDLIDSDNFIIAHEGDFKVRFFMPEGSVVADGNIETYSNLFAEDGVLIGGTSSSPNAKIVSFGSGNTYLTSSKRVFFRDSDGVTAYDAPIQFYTDSDEGAQQWNKGTIIGKGEVIGELGLRTGGSVDAGGNIITNETFEGKKLQIETGIATDTGIEFKIPDGAVQSRITHNGSQTMYIDLFDGDNIQIRDDNNIKFSFY